MDSPTPIPRSSSPAKSLRSEVIDNSKLVNMHRPGSAFSALNSRQSRGHGRLV
jgi:hypothetical protein